MPHSIPKLVENALYACTELRSIIAGKSYDDLSKDRGLQLIIERLFEMIGEALLKLRNLDEATVVQIQNGHRIIGPRNLSNSMFALGNIVIKGHRIRVSLILET